MESKSTSRISSDDLFKQIEESRERARNRRANALKRFHIGDVAYPIHQSWFPTLWGIVVDINVTTHKITLNLNGITRQYDPEELVLTSPELKNVSSSEEERQRVLDQVEQTVRSNFRASRICRRARGLVFKTRKGE